MRDCQKLATALLRYCGHRRDAYAKKWINQKTGRKGYSFACRNNWNRGAGCVRALRREADESLKNACKGCKARVYVPVDEQVLLLHLLGQHSIGVYLIDPATNTVLFAVVDIDDPSRHGGKKTRSKPRKSRRSSTSRRSETRQPAAEGPAGPEQAPLVIAARIADAAAKLGITAFIEKSAGGAGSHAWVFFSEPVPAETAQRLMAGLVAIAGVKTPVEVFPKQASIAEDDDGMGCLIAVPFAGPDAVAEGRSTFFDPDDLVPIQPFFKVFEQVASALVPPQQIEAALAEMKKAHVPLLPTKKRKPMASRRPGKEGADGDRSKYFELAPDAVNRLFTNCAALRSIRDDGGQSKHHLTHDQRLAVASLLRDLPGGREVLHTILRACPDYDKETSDYYITTLTRPPIRCDKLMEMGLCTGRCEEIKKRAKARSPVTFCYRRKGMKSAKPKPGNGRRVDDSPVLALAFETCTNQVNDLSPRERFRQRFGI